MDLGVEPELYGCTALFVFLVQFCTWSIFTHKGIRSITLVMSLLVLPVHRKECPIICVSLLTEATFKSGRKWPWRLAKARSAWVLGVSRACCVTQTSPGPLAELSASVLTSRELDRGRIKWISDIRTGAYFTVVETIFKRHRDDSSVHLWILNMSEEQWTACPRLSSLSTVSLHGFAPLWTVT